MSRRTLWLKHFLPINVSICNPEKCAPHKICGHLRLLIPDHHHPTIPAPPISTCLSLLHIIRFNIFDDINDDNMTDPSRPSTKPATGGNVPWTLVGASSERSQQSSANHSKESSTTSLSSEDPSVHSQYDTRSTTPNEPETVPAAKSRFETPAVTNGSEVEVVTTAIGLLPDEVYSRAMSSWRASFRRSIVSRLAWESEVIAAIQVCC